MNSRILIQTVCHSADEAPPVLTALNHLREDFLALSDSSVAFSISQSQPAPGTLLIGSINGNQAIEKLASTGRLPSELLGGRSEFFCIQRVVVGPDPRDEILVVAGSDPRGTAYGIYTLAERLGISPWHWFADVRPLRRPAILWTGEDETWSPAVRLRGIFINDETWGLRRWYQETFSPGTKPYGADFYRRLFELLMRLRANLLWPSMWVEGPKIDWPSFFQHPENIAAANDYGILLGSSHGEALNCTPADWLLWTQEHNANPAWDYAHNRSAMEQFWADRLHVMRQTECVFTIGLRGLNDEPMEGADTTARKIAVVENALASQRRLLAEALAKPAPEIPQVFCPYKEVLDLYRAGLHVPDDVTVLFTDDNFGYLRRLDALPPRTGGYGMYYHLNYYGGPRSHLWLNGTPLALIHLEMSKAWQHGIRDCWVVNVGDLKPHEVGVEYFLRLAADIGTSRETTPDAFLTAWATRDFATSAFQTIADAQQEILRLNHLRRPDLAIPGQWDEAEATALLDAWRIVLDQLETARPLIPAERRDAFHQLLHYPAHAAYLAHLSVVEQTRALLAAAQADAETTRHHAAACRRAHADLDRETSACHAIADGKWRGIMESPRHGHNWQSPWQPPLHNPAPLLPDPDAPPPAPIDWPAGLATPLAPWPQLDTLLDWPEALTAARPVALVADFECTLTLEASSRLTLLWAIRDTDNFCWLEFDPRLAQAGRRIAGIDIPLAWHERASLPRNKPVTLRLTINGSLLEFWCDGTLFLQTRSPMLSGLSGMLALAHRQGTLQVHSLAHRPLPAPGELFFRGDAVTAISSFSHVRILTGLGRSGSMACCCLAAPREMDAVLSSAAEPPDFVFTLPSLPPGALHLRVRLHALPRQPVSPFPGQRCAISLSAAPPVVVDFAHEDNPWDVTTASTRHRAAVLAGRSTAEVEFPLLSHPDATLPAIRIWALDYGVTLDSLECFIL